MKPIINLPMYIFLTEMKNLYNFDELIETLLNGKITAEEFEVVYPEIFK
jgi:hypothetical protein